MDTTPPPYDSRYLAGVVLFNRGDFFEAHEAWEELWMDTHTPERQFYQGLIQAAVGLCHFCNGNVRGAAKLYRSSRDYMQPYGSPFLGLDQGDFWGQMDRCFAALVVGTETPPGTPIVEELIPSIAIDPAPETWPDPAEFVELEDEEGE